MTGDSLQPVRLAKLDGTKVEDERSSRRCNGAAPFACQTVVLGREGRGRRGQGVCSCKRPGLRLDCAPVLAQNADEV